MTPAVKDALQRLVVRVGHSKGYNMHVQRAFSAYACHPSRTKLPLMQAQRVQYHVSGLADDRGEVVGVDLACVRGAMVVGGHKLEKVGTLEDPVFSEVSTVNCVPWNVFPQLGPQRRRI